MSDLLHTVLNAPESATFALIHPTHKKVLIGYTTCLIDRLMTFKHESLSGEGSLSSVYHELQLEILETFDHLDMSDSKKELYLKTKASEAMHHYHSLGYDFYNARNIIVWRKEIYPEEVSTVVRHVIQLVNAVGKRYRIKHFVDRDEALSYLDNKLPSEMIFDMSEKMLRDDVVDIEK